MTTDSSQHPSRRNPSTHRLCIGAVTTQWRFLRFGPTGSNPFSVHPPTPSLAPAFINPSPPSQLSSLFTPTWLKTNLISPQTWINARVYPFSGYHDDLILVPFALFAIDPKHQRSWFELCNGTMLIRPKAHCLCASHSRSRFRTAFSPLQTHTHTVQEYGSQ